MKRVAIVSVLVMDLVSCRTTASQQLSSDGSTERTLVYINDIGVCDGVVAFEVVSSTKCSEMERTIISGCYTAKSGPVSFSGVSRQDVCLKSQSSFKDVLVLYDDDDDRCRFPPRQIVRPVDDCTALSDSEKPASIKVKGNCLGNLRAQETQRELCTKYK